MAEYTWELTDSVSTTETFALSETFTLSDPAASFIFSDFLGGATIFQTLTGAVGWVVSRLRLGSLLEWAYTGNLAPGDRMIINRTKRRVLLNGADVKHLTTGKIPVLHPGYSTLKYSDSEASRTVRVRVSWRGRWL